MSTHSMGIRWPADQWQAIQEAAQAAGMTSADWIRAAVRERLDGGGIEARLAERIDRLSARLDGLPAETLAVAREDQARRRAAREAQEAGA